MARIDVRDVSLSFGDVAALVGIDLAISDGELMAVVGPSGSGKSSLLRIIAGLQAPTSGRVLFDGQDVTPIKPADRRVAMVFQDYALYRTRTAGENIEFPLRLAHTPEPGRSERTRAQAEFLGVEGMLDRYPTQLGAGHQQAVATARALVKDDAAVLLMDEPLANLDARARVTMRRSLKRMHSELGGTIAYVTNDQAEAMALGDRLVVLADGRIQQVGEPIDVYRQPANRTVATFVGSPSMRIVPGEIAEAASSLELLVGTDRLPLRRSGLSEWVGRPVEVGIRPEHLRATTPGTDFARCLHGRVTSIEDTGDAQYVGVSLGVGEAEILAAVPVRAEIGDPIELDIAIERLSLFDPANGDVI